jgi:hypothetical protein
VPASARTQPFACTRALLAAAALACAAPQPAPAHSASDAYLNLTVEESEGAEVLIHGQWDIALRDLDFALHLDDDGDGRLTWGEVRHHEAAIERYAYASLAVVDASGRACATRPLRHMIDEHADGAYDALFFDVICPRAVVRPKLDYRLFFSIDPSHRAILVMRRGAAIATAVLSPDNRVVELPP